MNDTLSIDSFPQVNYEKSIKRQRLIYKTTFSIVFNYIIGYPLSVVFMFMGIIPLLFKSTSGSHAPVCLMVCSLIFTCWMIANLILTNTLVKISGKDRITNRNNILKALDAFYPNLEYQVDEAAILRSIKPTGSIIWGRIITVLLDDDCIYLNITTLGKTENPTFIHGFFNYVKARRVIKYLKSQQVRLL